VTAFCESALPVNRIQVVAHGADHQRPELPTERGAAKMQRDWRGWLAQWDREKRASRQCLFANGRSRGANNPVRESQVMRHFAEKRNRELVQTVDDLEFNITAGNALSSRNRGKIVGQKPDAGTSTSSDQAGCGRSASPMQGRRLLRERSFAE
jgi:hypothetical protein